MSAKRRPQSVETREVQPARPIDSPYLTSEEARVYLRLGSESALYRLIREWKLPVCRRGRLYLFDTRELDAWVKGFPSAIELVRSRKVSA